MVTSEPRGGAAKTCGRDGRRDASMEFIRPLPIGDSGLAVGSTVRVGDAGGVFREEHLDSKTDEGDLNIFSAVSIDCLTCSRLLPGGEMGGSRSVPPSDASRELDAVGATLVASRSWRSLSLFRIQFLSTWAHSNQPFCFAINSGVTPCLSGWLA